MNNPKMCLIWAQDQHQIIGKDNTLPWQLSADLKHFSSTTRGAPVIMGRNTWDSFPDKYKPLPGRPNIVLTSDIRKFFKTNSTDDVTAFDRLEDAIEFAKTLVNDSNEYFVIGGHRLFADTFAMADKLYVTKVLASVKGDTYFPTVDWRPFRLEKARLVNKDEKNQYPFMISVYNRDTEYKQAHNK